MLGNIEVIFGATPEMIHNWGWFLAFGIVLLLLGIAAVARSVTATVASMVFFGWLMLFASIIEFVKRVHRWKVSRILPAHTGRDFLRNHGCAVGHEASDKRAEAVTFLMSVFFLIAGLYQFVAALWTHLPGWGWQALNGALSSIMGILILSGWPVSGLWVIGLFVGIDLLVYGSAWIAQALDLHKM